jgi:hypothetical protein
MSYLRPPYVCCQTTDKGAYPQVYQELQPDSSVRPVQLTRPYHQPDPPVNMMQPRPQRDLNPNFPGVPRNSHQYDGFRVGQRQWSYDLLDCFGDFGTCCLATWCPFIVYQQVKNRLDYLRMHERPDPERGGSGFGSDCCLYLLLNCCCRLGWILQVNSDFFLQDNGNDPSHAVVFIR